MKNRFLSLKGLLLVAGPIVSLLAGAIALQSCAGEGGSVGGGGGGGGGGGSLSQQFLALLPPGQAGATYVGSETCGQSGCHGPTDTSDIYTEWQGTKHFTVNVGCEQCHGPGSVHAAGPSEDNILTFPKVVDPVVCGQCHGPTYSQYEQSAHAELIESPVHEAVVNPNQYGRSSRCFICHSGLARTQIYERGMDLATMTDAEIIEIAENALEHVPQTAQCATCHNPHKQTGNLSKEGHEYQIRHKVHNEDVTAIAPGTTVVQFQAFDQQCGECHNGRGADGGDAKLQSSTSRPNMHDSNQFNTLAGIGGSEGPTGPVQRNMAHFSATGQCTKCHMGDSRHSFTVSYDTGCVPCHTPADAAARKAALTSEMLARLFALRTRMENWATANYNASTPGYANVDPRLFPYLWDYSSIITSVATELGISTTNIPSTHQASLPIEVKRARHNYYFIVRDSSLCPHNPPYARYLMDYANEQMDALIPDAPGKSAPRVSAAQMRRVIEQDRVRARQADLEALVNGGDE